MKPEPYSHAFIPIRGVPEHELRERAKSMGANPELENWIVQLVRALCDWEVISRLSDDHERKLKAENDHLRREISRLEEKLNRRIA